MKNILLFSIPFLLILGACTGKKPKQDQQTIKGWNILTNHDTMAARVIKKAKAYDINHLQLSHSIVMDLKNVKNPEVAKKTNYLTRKAHEAGIEEVTVWDHSLYRLDYYPDKFKTGPNGTINLDNNKFWQWIKNDYRGMLDKIPGIDGIILTFIETGAHVEDQYSEKLKTEEAKLSAMVDTLASVIIDERGLKLYVRTFIYTRAELNSLLKAVNMISNPKVQVMTKETPHDFFLTHPVSSFVKDIKSPTIIEFDAAHEYNGQGIIASIFPETHLKRWQYYAKLPNVIGYVARTDRWNNTSIINNPAEINLFALKKAVENQNIHPDSIYNTFIANNYGKACIKYLNPAFKLAPEIILSSLYTLGLALNTHSRLDIENESAYQRHVSGKWLVNQNIHLARGIDTTLHYWKEIVNHLSPAWNKGKESNQLAVESHWVLDSGWLEPVEKMNQDYLALIAKEKSYSVKKAKEALALVKKAESCATNKAMFDTTLHVFERTLMTAELYKAVANAYFGYRVYARGKQYQTPDVKNTLETGLNNLTRIIGKMMDYPYTGPEGQYVWREDAYRAMQFYIDVKSMDNYYKTPYTKNTFKKFSYSGPSKEEKKVIIEQYQSLVEKHKE